MTQNLDFLQVWLARSAKKGKCLCPLVLPYFSEIYMVTFFPQQNKTFDVFFKKKKKCLIPLKMKSSVKYHIICQKKKSEFRVTYCRRRERSFRRPWGRRRRRGWCPWWRRGRPRRCGRPKCWQRPWFRSPGRWHQSHPWHGESKGREGGGKILGGILK